MLSFLYFEDDPLSRKVMYLLLTRKLGYQDVTILENSQDYLKAIQALPYKPDIIFVDIHMQPHNGFEVLKGIRDTGAFIGTKIVAITASVMSEEVELLHVAGFDGVIGKPISGNTFHELLNRIIEGDRVWRPTS
jgi:CheY-like chemotaxis protein